MAITFLSADQTGFNIANSNDVIVGSTGTESVNILAGVTGVTLDQNTESATFAGNSNTYLFQQAGNVIRVYNAAGVKVTELPLVLNATDTSMTFDDGKLPIAFSNTTNGAVTLGGATVTTSDTPAAVVATPDTGQDSPDTVSPTIIISSDVTTLSVGETAAVIFTLSEASTDFTESDIVTTGGILSNFSGSGTAYSATFTPTANRTTVAIISVASSQFSDDAGNNNVDGSDTNNSVSMTVDTMTPPAASLLSNINTGLGVLSTAKTEGVSILDSGMYWDLTTNNEITYSYNLSSPKNYDDYDDYDLTSNFTPLNTEQQAAMNAIFTQMSEIVDVIFREVPDTIAQSDGDIQLNIIDMTAGGFAFYPDDSFLQGDIFLSTEINTIPDNYGLMPSEGGWSLMAHELGHAMGLQHPSNDPNTSDNSHTVMSYFNNNGQSIDVLADPASSNGGVLVEYSWVYPQLYSLYDISALQSAYGVNENTNLTDSTYSFAENYVGVSTLWDAGGIDTIDASITTGTNTIDLNSGTLNSIDMHTIEEISVAKTEEVNSFLTGGAFYSNPNWVAENIAYLENTSGVYTGENNLGIAQGVIIENVITGSGNDVITDNKVDNNIKTGLGDDSIYLGSGGFDSVDGGLDADTLYVGALESDVLITEIATGSYELIADNFAVQFTGIETLQFSDSSQWDFIV